MPSSFGHRSPDDGSYPAQRAGPAARGGESEERERGDIRHDERPRRANSMLVESTSRSRAIPFRRWVRFRRMVAQRAPSPPPIQSFPTGVRPRSDFPQAGRQGYTAENGQLQLLSRSTTMLCAFSSAQSGTGPGRAKHDSTRQRRSAAMHAGNLKGYASSPRRARAPASL